MFEGEKVERPRKHIKLQPEHKWHALLMPTHSYLAVPPHSDYPSPPPPLV
jgi:hypothetical protein